MGFPIHQSQARVGQGTIREIVKNIPADNVDKGAKGARAVLQHRAAATPLK